MLLNRQSLDIPARFAGHDDPRYALHLAEIDGSRIAASDGHRLCIVTHPEEGKLEEFPAVGQSPKLKRLGTATLLVNAAALQNVAKALPKGRKVKRPILRNALVDTTKALKDSTVPFHVTDLDTSRTIEVKKERTRYPNWRQLLPKQEPEYRIVVDATYLQDIGKAFADFRVEARQPSVTIEFHGARAPIVFTSRNPETGQEMTILLMPMVGDKQGWEGANRTKLLSQWAHGIANSMDYPEEFNSEEA